MDFEKVKGDPLKITLGTVFLTTLVSLDGDGSTTYMICVAAMLPLSTPRYEHTDHDSTYVVM